MNQRLQIVTPEGEFIQTIGKAGAGPGELRDLSPKLCPSNLPFFRDDHVDEHERSSVSLGADGGADAADGDSGAASPIVERHARSAAHAAAVPASPDDESGAGGVEQLAHGAAFVGRHLEIHKILQSCLHNQVRGRGATPRVACSPSRHAPVV